MRISKLITKLFCTKLPFANTLSKAGEGHYEVHTHRTAPTPDAGKSISRAVGRGGPRKSRILKGQ
jgi:hypothetical protein